MADRKITLKRNNAGVTEVLYPTTTVDQIYSSNGLTAAFDSSSKLKYSFLPAGITGGLKFVDTLTAAEIDTDAEFAGLMNYLFTEYGVEGMSGSYYIASENITVDLQGNSTQASGTTTYFQSTGVNQSGATGEEEPDDSTQLQLETGDWLIVTAVTGTGTSGDPYLVQLGVVNNTYQDATTSQKGVVELATNAETSTGTDTTRAVTPAGLASVLAGYSTTDNDTTYSISVGGVDDAPTIVLTAGGSGSGTDSISFSVGSQATLNISGDTIEIDAIVPALSLNGSTLAKSGNFSFYAPTASGTAGSGTVTRQALFSAGAGAAPTWADAPNIFYDTTTGWLHGDIVIDVDA